MKKPTKRAGKSKKTKAKAKTRAKGSKAKRKTKPKKMKIGVDLDDVLFEFNKLFCDFSAEKYGTTLKRENIHEFNMMNVWKLTKEEVEKRVSEFWSTWNHGESDPKVGSIDAIRELGKDHELHIVTSRADAMRETTLNWINRHFPDLFSGIHFTNQFMGTGQKVTKAEMCKKLGIELFIDDCMDHVHDLTKNGISVLVFDNPWNRNDVLPEKSRRVLNWEEIASFLNGKKAE